MEFSIIWTKKVLFPLIQQISIQSWGRGGGPWMEDSVKINTFLQLFTNTIFTYKPTLSIQKTFYHTKPPSIFHLD